MDNWHKIVPKILRPEVGEFSQDNYFWNGKLVHLVEIPNGPSYLQFVFCNTDCNFEPCERGEFTCPFTDRVVKEQRTRLINFLEFFEGLTLAERMKYFLEVARG